MNDELKRLTNFLVELGIERIAHTQKTYMAHVMAVYRLMDQHGCTPELCRAGMFHSIYGTERFQGFKLPLEQRPDVRALIGDRSEKLAYLNCAMDRASLDRVLDQDAAEYRITDRLTGQEVSLPRADYDDLCRVHLFDWLEQVPRSQYGWGYRREAFRRMAERLGGNALSLYDQVFAQEPVAAGGN
jgi:hypothetical protein